MLLDRPPVVRVQPLSQKVYLSGQLRLQVAADGNLPMFFQWRFNGEDLSGATDAALTLNNLVLAWGVGGQGPLGTGFVAIAPFLGLRNNGTVGSASWPAPIGLTGVVEIAGGSSTQFLARKSDGTVITWGSTNSYGLWAIPSPLSNAIAVGCGRAQSLVALGDGSLRSPRMPTRRPCCRRISAVLRRNPVQT